MTQIDCLKVVKHLILPGKSKFRQHFNSSNTATFKTFSVLSDVSYELHFLITMGI